ncbi:Uncharacterized protein TCM_002945 [Theobroma cacao]|uniref:Uncharacterized protein n=1 Tax=Theobroma cacao TaxID=3641 RepID=A0A061DV95_THECC|nr:Uncharacterized protein TCM_002945 [Theobroma cacao]
MISSKVIIWEWSPLIMTLSRTHQDRIEYFYQKVAPPPPTAPPLPSSPPQVLGLSYLYIALLHYQSDEIW